MSSGFAKPITIKEAVDQIVDRSYLLPAIQRKFVWTADKVESLFDSIMRGYPINSFMFWEIKDDNIKNNFRFYQFLTEYREFFKEDNPDIDTKGYKDFTAVIDGQQRLTGIYLGLKGTYAYKMPRLWWKDTEECLPTRRLYINLTGTSSEDDDRQMKYEIKFLSKNDCLRLSQDTASCWFLINDILKFKDENDLDNFIDEQAWRTNPTAKQTIRTLRKRIFEEPLINYYLVDKQDIDEVLDIFVRTNSGGEPLSFSNLLMSYITASWKLDARKEIPDVVRRVFEIGNPGFRINEDFVLKTLLVLFSESIKFKVKNFDSTQTLLFEENWDRVKRTIIEAFNLVSSWGFNDSSLRAKYAVIPLIYYIYQNGIEKDINNKVKHLEEKDSMRKWLCISILKGVFGGQTDSVLTTYRKLLHDNIGKGLFPLKEIQEEFRSNSAKNLSFNDDFIDGLLTIRKDAPNCYAVLSLLYSHLNFSIEVFHKDHLHPYNYFASLKEGDMPNVDDFRYYKDPDIFDTIVNLQLLNGALNESKLDMPLKDWVEQRNIDLDNQLIPKDVSLDVSDYREFIDRRRTLLKARFKHIVGTEE